MVGARRGVKVTAIEFELGPRCESNHELLLDNPSWDMAAIEQVTGITSRRLARPDQCASDLAVEAAERLFARGMISREQIDALIFCTQSPDYLLPTTACIIQERLKLPLSTAAFDINLGCSGYVYGLAIASAMIKGGLADVVLLLNADTYSRFISKDNRACRPVFGDGAAATVIEATDERDDAVGPFNLGTDGCGKADLMLLGSGTRDMFSASERPVLKLNGASLLLFAMDAVPKTVEALLRKGGFTKDQVDLYIFHQASKKTLENIVRRLDIPHEKVFCDFAEIGNTVSASIPIAIKQAETQGRLRPGQQIMLVGFGVGYSWGSCFLRWA